VPETTINDELQLAEGVAKDLQASLGAFLDSIPGVDRRPSALARAVGVNRVIASRLLNALKRDSPLEVLQGLPGPESLRSIVLGARENRAVPPEPADRADASIAQFASLIRECFGTRGALDAAISGDSDAGRKRFEESARYEVFNGMRRVLGVEGETWLNTMIFAPSPDPEAVSVTTLHGVLGLRRLRPDTPVRFSLGAPYSGKDTTADGRFASRIDLEEYCVNQPAALVTEERGGLLVHRLASRDVGKDTAMDMLAVAHEASGARRYASPDRRLGGAAIFPDIPVRTLIADVFVHDEIFPDALPELVVYNTGVRGPANPNDPSRDIDRVSATERIEALDRPIDELEVAGVTDYAAMLGRIFEDVWEQTDGYRLFRLRVPYPVLGFQYVVAFEAPEKG